MSRLKTLIRSTLGIMLFSLGGVAFGAEDIVDYGTLQCSMPVQKTSETWLVQMEEPLSLVTINGSDTPADFSPQHISIRLAFNGPVLTIGRVTGRLLASDSQGKTIGIGQCRPLNSA